ncbi:MULTISPECIES: endonuclease/exonuclease/phosphatase family protein [unclassified Ruegeria]|uniref:endonuclease/exonuclease/phosphatase family protein n=1 Tax=unclassified Ruegeria TaxID=2625375 RepID=UPI0014880E43|nr:MULTISPECIES: endonuclease/exonuclease/phosphatase family protein [unclassified Ruegeria]
MKREKTVRLASYNIQKCLGMDFRRQPQRTLQVIDSMKADIVVLQEADKRLPPRPAALPHFMLDEAGWQIVDLGGAGSLGWHGNAVIWRGAGLNVRQTGHHDLPGLEPRGAVRVEFDTPIGPLRVMGMHLGLLPASRRQQITHLRHCDAGLAQMPTVWAGDFNEWSRQPVLDHLAPDMSFLPPVPSFPAARPLGALDRIALGSGLQAAAHGVQTARPAHIASDHLPVWVDLHRAA